MQTNKASKLEILLEMKNRTLWDGKSAVHDFEHTSSFMCIACNHAIENLFGCTYEEASNKEEHLQFEKFINELLGAGKSFETAYRYAQLSEEQMQAKRFDILDIMIHRQSWVKEGF